MGNPKRKAATADGDEELHRAARSGDLEAVLRICTANPLAVNSRDKHSRTPIHLAAWSGQTKVVDFLSKKADVGAAAMDDMGAIHFAAQKGHTEIVRILISVGVPIKSCTRKGMTALHFAAQGSHLELVKYLVKKGANVNSRNKAGSTPADLASSEEVRAALAEPQPAPSKAVSKGKEKDAEAQPDSLTQPNADSASGEVQNQDDESVKRKSGENVTKEALPIAKKAKVALNHLLASDDTPDEEE